MKQRKRFLSPEYFQDEKVDKLKYDEQRLFQGLWTLADKRGLLDYIPEVIRSFIFPFKPKTDVKKMLKKMQELEFIDIYANGCKQYIHIRNFEKHQHPHPNEGQYDIPDLKELHLITFNLIARNVKRPNSNINSNSNININTNIVEQPLNDIPFEDIIKDLNIKAGSSYQPTSEATRNLIRHLWKHFNINDFFTVHSNMVEAWGADIKMKPYLRPSTLYRASKFEEYLNKPKKKELEWWK